MQRLDIWEILDCWARRIRNLRGLVTDRGVLFIFSPRGVVYKGVKEDRLSL